MILSPVAAVSRHSMEPVSYTHLDVYKRQADTLRLHHGYKAFFPYHQTFSTIWLRLFFLLVLSPQAFGVISQGFGVNSKAYGDNSKGYGDRIHPYKKA